LPITAVYANSSYQVVTTLSKILYMYILSAFLLYYFFLLISVPSILVKWNLNLTALQPYLLLKCLQLEMLLEQAGSRRGSRRACTTSLEKKLQRMPAINPFKPCSHSATLAVSSRKSFD